MLRRLFRILGSTCFLLSFAAGVLAADYTEQQALDTWAHWKSQPVTENNFRSVCDVIQDIGKNNISVSYRILAEYLPMVRQTGNRQWVHVLLMNWARAKESFKYFEEADSLYAQARGNAAGVPRLYDEALVGTVLLYAEWGRLDSLDKYVALGKTAAARVDDKESLSFFYTFGSIAHLTDTAVMGKSLQYAMELASGLRNKNALFTARYNYATIYCQYSPQKQVTELNALLELSTDSSLNHKPKLYERTTFYFRNPVASIYSQLMQVNLLLADYDAAWKFGELLYNAVVKPNPSASQAPYFDSELAIVKAYQGDYAAAREYLSRSGTLFRVPEEKIPYPSYFLAAGLVAEHENQPVQALRYFEMVYKMGPSEGLHMMPSQLYYAHGLVMNHRPEEAARVLEQLAPALSVRLYSAYGFYYYKYYAELLKAKGDYAGYAKALETYYSIKDSLASFHHYQVIQEIETRVRLRDKEQQIVLLNEENAQKQRDIRRDRIYFFIFLGLGVLIAFLLAGYIRNRVRQMRKQHRIDVMQGAIDAEESERHKIADQLHDEVGSMLSLATLNVSSTLEKGRTDIQAEEKLEKAQEILVNVSTTIRELSHRLTPVVIEKYGLRRAVEDMVYAVNLTGKLKVSTVVVGFDDATRYPPAFLKDCYRLVQELLNNILKHAAATEAMFELVEHPGFLSILADDNGVGMPDELLRSGGGKGLNTIRSKIAYLNGRIEISRKMEGGTLVVIELPVKTV